MTDLAPEKMNVTFADDELAGNFSLPRRYTLTHSDRTGDRFLTIGREFDLQQISGRYTRFMRDEVLAEWTDGDHGLELHIHLHVSGGLVFGHAGLRYRIFKSCLRSVLQALRYGDDRIYRRDPSLEACPTVVHFHSTCEKYDVCERCGAIGQYDLE